MFWGPSDDVVMNVLPIGNPDTHQCFEPMTFAEYERRFALASRQGRAELMEFSSVSSLPKAMQQAALDNHVHGVACADDDIHANSL